MSKILKQEVFRIILLRCSWVAIYTHIMVFTGVNDTGGK
jgi:hypothetical protein